LLTESVFIVPFIDKKVVEFKLPIMLDLL